MVQKRYLLLALLVLLTLGAGAFALNLKFNFSPDNLFLSNDASFHYYQEKHAKDFGAGDNSVVIAIAGNYKNENVRQAYFRFAEKIRTIKGVRFVRGFGDLPIIGAEGLGDATYADQASDEAIEQLRHHPLATGLMINETLDLATLFVQFENAWGSDSERSRLVKTLRHQVDLFDSQHSNLKTSLAGIPVSSDIVVDTLKRDQMRFVPLTVLVMALLLLFAFRSWRAVLYPFASTGCATLWCIAWLVMSGHHINVVNNAIVTLLLVISIADAVHIVARYRAERQSDQSVHNDVIVARTIEAMWIPCLLTTTTTGIGFASALVAEITLIKDFGIDAAIGVCFAFCSTFLLLPTGLSLFANAQGKKSAPSWVAQNLERTIARVIKMPWRITFAFVIVAVVSLVFAFNVSANQKLIGELPDDDPSVKAMRMLEKELTGLLPFDIAFVASPERLAEPDVLRAASRLTHLINAHPIGAKARSQADVYAWLDQSLGQGVKHNAPFEWSDEKIAQLALLISMNEDEDTMRAFESKNKSITRVMGLAPDAGSQVFALFCDALEKEISTLKLDGVEVRLTGAQVIASRALTHIVEDMAMSIGVALFVIFIFMSLLFRSLTLSAIALVPNALPICTTLAAMTLLSIELRVATAIIFSMSLGVAVDACVHYLMRFREEQKRGYSLDDALIRTAVGAGTPVVYATTLLLAGFAVMGASRFNAIRDFALLSGVTLFSALVIDVIWLPALLKLRAK